MLPSTFLFRRLLGFIVITTALTSITMFSGCGNYTPHPVGSLQQTTNHEAKVEFTVRDGSWVWWEWDIPTNKVPDLNVVCELENLGKNSVWARILTEEYLKTGKGEQIEVKVGEKAVVYSGPLIKMISPTSTYPINSSSDPTQPLYIAPHRKKSKLALHVRFTNDFQANPPLKLMLREEQVLP
jgi:hypothetical protein